MKTKFGMTSETIRVLKIITNFFLPILLILGFQTALADELTTPPPRALFEWGVVGATGNVADYPASDQSRVHTLALPFIVYRGELFKTDNQDGARFKLFNLQNFDIDLSFGGSFQTDADNNDARQGMPKLDWTLELGPRLLYYFYQNPNKAMFRFGFPFREVLVTDFQSLRHIGSTVAPTLQADFYNIFTQDLNFYMIANWNFLNEGLADYFYGVSPSYQTATRPAYDARAGFLSYDLSLSASYQWKKVILLLGSRYSDYSQSTNTMSPLHRKNIDWNYFLAVGWMFYESDAREVPEAVR